MTSCLFPEKKKKKKKKKTSTRTFKTTNFTKRNNSYDSLFTSPKDQVISKMSPNL